MKTGLTVVGKSEGETTRVVGMWEKTTEKCPGIKKTLVSTGVSHQQTGGLNQVHERKPGKPIPSGIVRGGMDKHSATVETTKERRYEQ